MSAQSDACADTFQELQDEICRQLESLDGGGGFREDTWVRRGGGGGRSRVITGDLIEKGGVNFSAVHGDLGEQAGEALGTGAGTFFATGVSIVLHPRNPWVPIIHMNVRYFELAGTSGEHRWWFGGGIDLTPHYVDRAAAKQFHAGLAKTCAAHDVCADYANFKRKADEYFYLPHREETRGVGGIFFDRLTEPDFAAVFDFTRAVGKSFLPLYRDQVTLSRGRAFGEDELRWQRLRRGRYVEFNLVWDRGTRFGLETNGRTDSILMSMPPRADWTYDHQVAPDSPEALTLSYLRKGVDWLHG